MTHVVSFRSGCRSLGSNKQALSEPTLNEAHHLREKAVREDIARRLRRVCSNLSEEEFDSLVAQMADRQVKRERRLVW